MKKRNLIVAASLGLASVLAPTAPFIDLQAAKVEPDTHSEDFRDLAMAIRPELKAYVGGD